MVIRREHSHSTYVPLILFRSPYWIRGWEVIPRIPYERDYLDMVDQVFAYVLGHYMPSSQVQLRLISYCLKNFRRQKVTCNTFLSV